MRALGILGAVAALLAAYVIFFDHDPRDAASPAEATRLVPPFDQAGVRRVAIARAGDTPFALVRREPAAPWRIDPGDALADQAAVGQLLTALDTAESQRTADIQPEAAGLAPPAVKLTLEAGAAVDEVALGRPDASGRGVFVRSGEAGPVRVGPRGLLEIASRPAAALRDRRALPFAPDSLAHVGWQMDAGAPVHRWNRVAGRWRNADEARLAPEKVASALNRLTELRADDSGPVAGAPAGGWIEVGDEAGRPERVATSGIARDAMEKVWHALAAADLPDRRLLPVPADRVRRMELDDGDQRLVLARAQAAGAWKFETPRVPYQPDQTAVDDWLRRLGETQATPPSKPLPGRGQTPRRLVVDGDTADAVSVGPRDPAYQTLDPDPARFRSRVVLDFAHFDARELRRISAAGTLVATSSDGETWTSASGAQPAALARLVTTLGNLRAESFLGKAPRGRPQLALEVSVQPPGEHAPTQHTVELFAGCAARLDHAVAFNLPDGTCTDLRLDPAGKP